MDARDPFQDAALYDWEYRRRRDDVRFYGTLADERGGPVLDLGCGTGRLLLPLVRAGHTVVGLDRAPAMLARAAARVARLAAPLRRRALLLRADLRRLPIAGPRFELAVAAFHTVQHLATDRELRGFFAEVARALRPGGWFAFDTFAPDEQFLARANAPGDRRWARTRFCHPATGRQLEYSESYRLDGRILTSTFHYRAVGRGQRGAVRDRRVDLVHRLLEPAVVRRLANAAGLELIASWGGFDGRPLDPPTEQHVFLLRRGAPHHDDRGSHGRQKK